VPLFRKFTENEKFVKKNSFLKTIDRWILNLKSYIVSYNRPTIIIKFFT
jgi:hypothetical protein